MFISKYSKYLLEVKQNCKCKFYDNEIVNYYSCSQCCLLCHLGAVIFEIEWVNNQSSVVSIYLVIFKQILLCISHSGGKTFHISIQLSHMNPDLCSCSFHIKPIGNSKII